MADYRLILSVGSIARHRLTIQCPITIAQGRVFTQVCQRNDVTCVRGGTRFIGDPYLHAVNLYTRHQVGKCRHGLVVALTEIMREEEVAVFFVVGCIQLEGSCLCTAFRRDTLRR